MSSALWSIEFDYTAPDTFLAHDALLREIVEAGTSPAGFRHALARFSADGPLQLELLKPDDEDVYEQPTAVGDMLLFMSWLPVFSEKAYQLLMTQGCSSDEFVDCHLRVMQNAAFRIHAPLQSYDVIDPDRSAVSHWIQSKPPFPFKYKSAVLRPGTGQLPPCFRVGTGHPEQVLTQLFAADRLRSAWVTAGLKGAKFHPLSPDAA